MCTFFFTISNFVVRHWSVEYNKSVPKLTVIHPLLKVLHEERQSTNNCRHFALNNIAMPSFGQDFKNYIGAKYTYGQVWETRNYNYIDKQRTRDIGTKR